MEMLVKEKNIMTSCMYPMSIEVIDEIKRCQEIQKEIKESGLDDVVLSWTGMFLHSVYHIFKDIREQNDGRKWNNSILFCGLSSQAMQLDWLIYSMYCGQYDLGLRELRNMLESAFLFYRGDYDIKFRNSTLEQKAEELEKLKKQRMCGKEIFKNSGYVEWKKAYKLYGELSGYIHMEISLDNAKRLFEDFNAYSCPIYEKERVLECIHYIEKVIVMECNLMESILKEVYEIEDTNFASIFKGEE